MENWIEKYKPTNQDDVICDSSTMNRIENFIKIFSKKFDPEQIKNPNLLITGPNGIGKSLIVDLMLEKYGITKINSDMSSITITRKKGKKNANKADKEYNSSHRTVITYYNSIISKNMLSYKSKDPRRVAMVIDNVSNVSNPKEKEAIKAFVKLNVKLKKFPIIIITNTRHSKVVNDLRKLASYKIKTVDVMGKKITQSFTNEVVIQLPNYSDVELFVKNICQKEKLKLISSRGDDENIYTEIIDHSQYDIRRLVGILEELKLIYGDSNITLQDVRSFCETSKKKDLDPGIFEATKLLLNKYTGITSALTLYSEERTTIPLMVHENYPLNVDKQYPKKTLKDKIDIIFNISKSISESDKVEGLIYSNQCWSLQPVHGFYSCVVPSFQINAMPGKLSNQEIYRYTQDYNKTSIKKINNKVIKKAQENPFLKKVSIYDFLYISSFITTLLERKEIPRIIQLIKPYGLTTYKEIESIIRIDKMKNTKDLKKDKSKPPKNPITNKQKNMFKELLEN